MRTRSAIALAFLIAGGDGVWAAPEAFRVDGVPREDGLAIREAPDAAAPVVGRIPVGRRLLGFGCNANTPSGLTWCRVKFDRVVGWSRRRYLTPD